MKIKINFFGDIFSFAKFICYFPTAAKLLFISVDYLRKWRREFLLYPLRYLRISTSRCLLRAYIRSDVGIGLFIFKGLTL